MLDRTLQVIGHGFAQRTPAIRITCPRTSLCQKLSEGCDALHFFPAPTPTSPRHADRLRGPAVCSAIKEAAHLDGLLVLGRRA